MVADGAALKSILRSCTARYSVPSTHSIPVGLRLKPGPFQIFPTDLVVPASGSPPIATTVPRSEPRTAGVPVIRLTTMSSVTLSCLCPRSNPVPSPLAA